MRHSIYSMFAVWLAISVPLCAQNYFNLRYLDGSERNLPVTSLQRVTFDESGGTVDIRLNDGTTEEVAFTALQNLSWGDAAAGTLLPVELTSFGATTNETSVVLSWTTATEVNNYGFDIQRRTEATAWGTVGFVRGNGTTSTPTRYSFTDAPAGGTTFQYRLRQIDADGSAEYSGAISARIGSSGAFELKQNYPNPFNPKTTISYSLQDPGMVHLRIYDMLGREMAILADGIQSAGSHSVTFDASHLSSGVYTCRMTAAAQTRILRMIIAK